MLTIETMLEALQKCPDCVLDLSEATEQEIKTEYSLLKKIRLLSDKSNHPKHNRKRGVHETDHSD